MNIVNHKVQGEMDWVIPHSFFAARFAQTAFYIIKLMRNQMWRAIFIAVR